MDVFSCIATRHSTRKFKEEPVPQELLDKVIEAGRQAPSGKHKNQDHFLVIRKQETMQELAALVRQEFAKMEVTPENDDNFGGAIRASKKGSYTFLYNPAAFIIVANKKDYGNNFADASCAMQNMMLAANALGLGSCWINRAKEEFETPEGKALLKEWGLPEHLVGVGHCIVGYGDGPEPAAAPRKPDFIKFVK